MEKYKYENSLYNYSAYLDDKYGTSGTPSREAFLDDALEWMRSEIGEDEFNEWARKNHLYAEA